MPAKPSLLFRAVGLMAAVFVVTVFIMVAALFSDPELTINQWLNHYALHLLLGEVALLLILGFLAMMTDQSLPPQTDQRPTTNDQSRSAPPP